VKAPRRRDCLGEALGALDLAVSSADLAALTEAIPAGARYDQQILNVTEAQGEPDIKPDCLLDNLGREAVAAIADLDHHRWLRLMVIDGKPADNVTRPSPAFSGRGI
jgi:hypothetical protein